MNITLVLGTARKENNSSKVFDFVEKSITEMGHKVIPVKVEDYLLSYTSTLSEDGDNKVKISSWAEAVGQSEAVIFISPEYNHSYPGELKLLIDSLYDEYKGKKAGIIGVSMGPFGGVRVVELLKLLLLTANFDVVNETIAVSSIGNGVDESRTLKQLESLMKNINE